MHHIRKFTFVAGAAAAVAACLVAVGASPASAAPLASPEPRTISVSAGVTGFSPSAVTVQAGESVSICLTSEDADHDLTIPDLNFKVVASMGVTSCSPLLAPSKAGSHKIIGSVPVTASADLVGTLVVAPAPTTKAPTTPGVPKTKVLTTPKGVSVKVTTTPQGLTLSLSSPSKAAGRQVRAVPSGGQVQAVPSGAVETGGGSTAGSNQGEMVMLGAGGGLLLLAFLIAMRGRHAVARKD